MEDGAGQGECFEWVYFLFLVLVFALGCVACGVWKAGVWAGWESVVCVRKREQAKGERGKRTS